MIISILRKLMMIQYLKLFLILKQKLLEQIILTLAKVIYPTELGLLPSILPTYFTILEKVIEIQVEVGKSSIITTVCSHNMVLDLDTVATQYGLIWWMMW